MQEGRRLFPGALAIVVAVTLARIAVLIVSPLELYPDEAQYWWWAQTPDLGYFSKPPLIAWIIWATTALFGDSEWAIRLGMPLLHGGAALLLFAIGRAGFPKSPAVAFWSALAYLTLPGVSYSAGLASTDAPLLFFWALALFAFIRGVQTKAWSWAFLCGVGLGFGILAKYAMLFFAVSAALAAIANADIRRFVLGRGGLLAVVVAGLIVAPNLIWNAAHHFATFAHTETNADWTRARFSLLHLAGFLAGQFGVFGPILMAAWLAALWRLGRAAARTMEEIALIAFSTAPLLLITVQSFVADANANWAATAFVAAVPLALDEILRLLAAARAVGLVRAAWARARAVVARAHLAAGRGASGCGQCLQAAGGLARAGGRRVGRIRTRRIRRDRHRQPQRDRRAPLLCRVRAACRSASGTPTLSTTIISR